MDQPQNASLGRWRKDVSNSMTKSKALVVACLAAAACVAGCGYSSNGGSEVRAESEDAPARSGDLAWGYSADRTQVFRRTNSDNDRIRTVAVDIYQSREFRRGLELQLSEAIAKRVSSETPYRLAKKEFADSILTGEVKEVRQSTIGRDFRTVLPRETAATLIVSFQWKDTRNGEILVNRPNFVQTVDYTRRLDEDFYHAMQRATDRMAERIIETMESGDW